MYYLKGRLPKKENIFIKGVDNKYEEQYEFIL